MSRPPHPINYPEPAHLSVPDRWLAGLVLPDLDYDAQLYAIRGLLKCLKAAELDLDVRIGELTEFAEKSKGFRNERAVDELIAHFHESTYQSAAHSMASIGMIAPFIESVFFQAFRGIQLQFFSANDAEGHPRWVADSKQWDCHFVRGGDRWRKDLTAGILQLADATGLNKHLPDGFGLAIKALFEYRNKMFHCGFEWPIDERRRFRKRIHSAGWPEEWFSSATVGEEPWVIYMTSTMVDHCLTMIEDCIDGLGAFCRERIDDTG